MTDQTLTTITVPFEITGWDETVHDEPQAGPKLSRVTVRKRFTGALSGTSSAELLTAQGAGGSGYLASERIEASLDGRSGTFVVQHGGIDAADGQRSFGHVLAGSGTGGLAGLVGEARFEHERLTLSYAL